MKAYDNAKRSIKEGKAGGEYNIPPEVLKRCRRGNARADCIKSLKCVRRLWITL